MTSSPAQTPSSKTLKPAQTPRICGTVRRKPNVAPEAVSMTLFGPGVMDMTNEYVAKANGSIMWRVPFVQDSKLQVTTSARQIRWGRWVAHCTGPQPVRRIIDGTCPSPFALAKLWADAQRAGADDARDA